MAANVQSGRIECVIRKRQLRVPPGDNPSMVAKFITRALLAATLLSSFAAGAESLALSIGQTKTLVIPAPVTSIKVDDKALLAAKKVGRSVRLSGTALGKTSLHVTTVDGDELDFTVSIVGEGSTVYEMPSRR